MDNKLKDDMLNKVALGTRIRSCRKELNLTQENVAGMLDISNAYYGQIERGEGSPSLPIFVGICKILDKNPLWLLQDSLSITTDNIQTDSQTLISLYEKLGSKQKEMIDFLLQEFTTK